MTGTLTPTTTDGSAPTEAEATALLHLEARLLDERRYDEWLELFTTDGVYWIPLVDGDIADAKNVVSIIYDDGERRSERVFRTLHTPVLDQNPVSRCVHFVTNVEVLAGEETAEPRVLSNLLLTELRPGGDRQVGLNHLRLLAGRCEYRLRKEDGQWRIVLKKVLLIDADQPQYNLAFII
jgi:3-phenylpropionate/cinnamic acid dioxygenase small subunit